MIFAKEKIGYLLLTVGCVYLSGHSYSIIGGAIPIIGMLILCFIGCFMINPVIKLPKHVTFSGLFIVCVTIGAVFSFVVYWKRNIWLEPLMLITRICVAYMITTRIDIKQFARFFSSMMTFFSAVSIVIYLLTEQGVSIPAYEYMSFNDITYKTIGICTWSEQLHNVMGPFWEAGLYASFAIFAIIFEACFTGCPIRKFNMVILTLGVFFSKSTAGYILVVLAYYIIAQKGRKHKAIWDVLTLVLVMSVYLFSNQIIDFLFRWSPDIFWKLTQESITGNTRLLSPIACMRVFAENPITGLGMSYAIERYNLFKPIFGIDSLTSTSAFMLAAFGIWGISYTFMWCNGVWRQKEFSYATKFLMMVLFLLIVNKEPHYSILCTYIVMFYLNSTPALTSKSAENKQISTERLLEIKNLQ